MNSNRLKSFLLSVTLLFLSSAYANWKPGPPDSLAKALQNVTSDHERASTQFEIGVYYLDNHEPKEALEYLENAEIITQNLTDSRLEAIVLYRLGETYYELDRGLEAIDRLNAAVKIKDGLRVDEELEAYNIMGIIYLIFEENEKAIEYFNRCILLADEASKITGSQYDNLFNNKGITFSNMGLLDSAMANHNRCLAIRLKGNNFYRIGQSYNNLGTTFFDSQNYDSALVYFEWGLFYRNKMEDPPPSSIQESNINISKALIELDRASEAKSTLNQVAKEVAIVPNPTIELRLYELMLKMYGQLNDYKKAFEYSVKYYELKDSVFGIEQREELIRINLSSKFAEQKLQDSLINAEKIKLDEIRNTKEKEIRDQKEHNFKLVMIGLLVALVLMVGIVILVYRNYRSKKRASEEILMQKNEVEKQRDKVQHEKQIADQQTALANKQKMELELVHQEITDSINYAKRIQNAILPSDQSVQETLQNQFILYLPKAIVAGDFYWVREVDNFVYFAAADCTGHGVPGALVSIICSNALNRSIEEFSLRLPGEILDKTTDLLIEAFIQSNQEVKDGMDISLCCLNKSTKEISFAGANNPVYVVKKKTADIHLPDAVLQTAEHYLVEVKGDKQSVGWYENRKPFNTHQLEINKGDMVYSFSDGFPDQFGGPRGKKYKYKQFKNYLLKVAKLSTAEQLTQLEAEFRNWQNDLEQVDDVCIVGYRVT